MGWINRIRSGLQKTSSSISSAIHKIFHAKRLSQESLEDLQDTLIMTDIGIALSEQIIEELAKQQFEPEALEERIKESLYSIISQKLQTQEAPIKIKNKPHIILFCGVNGSGKTTTIGKLAHQYSKSGLKVMVAACDTFRAAAVEQLELWSKRSHATLFSDPTTSDPASIAFKALNMAISEQYDVLMIDTAGRLHNKVNLMEELSKIVRVLKKINPEYPHDTVLVLDATIGQNALIQAKTFQSTVDVTGIIITKLDGTAKGGIVVALSEQLKLPIHMICVGEDIEDLGPFNPSEFTKSLIG